MNDTLRNPSVIPLQSVRARRERRTRLSRAMEARRRLAAETGGGRAWINGREVGGTKGRYRHLGGTHD